MMTRKWEIRPQDLGALIREALQMQFFEVTDCELVLEGFEDADFR